MKTQQGFFLLILSILSILFESASKTGKAVKTNDVSTAFLSLLLTARCLPLIVCRKVALAISQPEIELA